MKIKILLKLNVIFYLFSGQEMLIFQIGFLLRCWLLFGKIVKVLLAKKYLGQEAKVAHWQQAGLQSQRSKFKTHITWGKLVLW